MTDAPQTQRRERMRIGVLRTLAGALAGMAIALVGADWSLQVMAGEAFGDRSALFGLLYQMGLLVFALVGALLAWRAPANPVGWLLAAIGITFLTESLAFAYTALAATPHELRGGLTAAWLSQSLWPLQLTLVVLLLTVFPTGRPASIRWRRYAWAVVVAGAAIAVAAGAASWAERGALESMEPNPFPGLLGIAFQLLAIFLVSAIAISAVGLVLRFRAATGLERQQLKLLAFAVLVLVGGVISGLVFDLAGWGTEALTVTLYSVGLLGIPVAIGVAVLRYRLYDVDVVISQTAAYTTLAVFITGVYVTVVVGLGSLLGAGAQSLALSIAATGLVAVAFEPVRRRTTGWANRLVYGRRTSPYQVLSGLVDRLAAAEPTQGMLARMAKLMADGTGAAQATVWLADKGQLVAAGGWPAMPESMQAGSMNDLLGVVHPVVHDDQLVGALQVLKPRGEVTTPAERRLLSDLAGSVGLVLDNQRLTTTLAARAAELRASRRRLVQIQDLERRRLERDLHDGAQQHVVALKVQIRLAERLARSHAMDQVADILAEVAGDAEVAVEEIRALARGIYPPLLESDGLAAALRSQVARLSVPVELRMDGIDRYPKDVESAVYFATLEAITNALKHAAPTRIVLALSEGDGHLVMEVADDGAGFDPSKLQEGTGLASIRDRIDALAGETHLTGIPGGGATLTTRVPVDRGEPGGLRSGGRPTVSVPH
jgi:signal transduction histidine kinase